MDKETRQQIYQYFGHLLDYPTPEIANQTRECAALLALKAPEAAGNLYQFLDIIDSTPMALGRLEEIYTATFDVSPACFIFAGYMLFGESFARGKFLVRLQERYRERGFSTGNELADHMAVIFRFLAILDPDTEQAQHLIEKCLVPVLQKMSANFKPDAERLNPYSLVLRAMLTVLDPENKIVPIMELEPALKNPDPFLNRVTA